MNRGMEYHSPTPSSSSLLRTAFAGRKTKLDLSWGWEKHLGDG